jgi:hypothetical protein
MTDDVRRFGMVEVHREGPCVHRLTVKGQLWASIEWSPQRKAWCIEDGIGRCLEHVEHIHGQDPDPARAIKLAKQMIRGGRMPTPEEANRRLQERLEQERRKKELGEPIETEELVVRDGVIVGEK